MVDSDNSPQYQAAQLQRKRRRKIALLADALAYRLFIPTDEKRLIWCLGKEGDTNNIEALRTWIDRQLVSNTDLKTHHLESELANNLERELESLQ